MAVCPFCAEKVKDAAIVCRHCGRFLGTAGDLSQRLRRIEEGIDRKLSLLEQQTYNSSAEPYVITCVFWALFCGIVSGFGYLSAWEASYGLDLVWLLLTFGVPLIVATALGYRHPGTRSQRNLGFLLIGLASALGLVLPAMFVMGEISQIESLIMLLVFAFSTWGAGVLGRRLRSFISKKRIWRPIGRGALALAPIVIGFIFQARAARDNRDTLEVIGGRDEYVETLGSGWLAPVALEEVLQIVHDGLLEEDAGYLSSPVFRDAMAQLRAERWIDYPGATYDSATVTESGIRRLGIQQATDISTDSIFYGTTSEEGIWLRLSAPMPSEFTIDVESDGDATLQLWDGSGDILLAENDDRGDEVSVADSLWTSEVRDPLIRRRLVAGTYFLRVGDFFNEEQRFRGIVLTNSVSSSAGN